MYRIIDFHMPIVLAVVTLLYMVRYVFGRIRKIHIEKFWAEYAFVIYILGVVKYAFLPIIIMDNQRLTYLYGKRGRVSVHSVLKIIPTERIRELLEQQEYVFIGISFVLLIPMCFFLNVYRKEWGKKKIFLIICMMALGIELLQFIICIVTKYAHSVCSTDDFLLMVLGAGGILLLGHLISKRNNISKVADEKGR